MMRDSAWIFSQGAILRPQYLRRDRASATQSPRPQSTQLRAPLLCHRLNVDHLANLTSAYARSQQECVLYLVSLTGHTWWCGELAFSAVPSASRCGKNFALEDERIMNAAASIVSFCSSRSGIIGRRSRVKSNGYRRVNHANVTPSRPIDIRVKGTAIHEDAPPEVCW